LIEPAKYTSSVKDSNEIFEDMAISCLPLYRCSRPLIVILFLHLVELWKKQKSYKSASILTYIRPLSQ